MKREGKYRKGIQKGGCREKRRETQREGEYTKMNRERRGV